jgi:hypothetical protein
VEYWSGWAENDKDQERRGTNMTTPNDTPEPSLASAGSHNTHMATARLSAANTWLQEEIKRLRLTDEERGVLSRLGSDTREWDKYSNGRPWFVTVKDAAIIRGILERLG